MSHDATPKNSLWHIPDLEKFALSRAEEFSARSQRCHDILSLDLISDRPGFCAKEALISPEDCHTSSSIAELIRAARGLPQSRRWLYDGEESLAWAWMELSPLERRFAQGLDATSLCDWLHGSFFSFQEGLEQIPFCRAWIGGEIFARERSDHWRGLRRLMRAKAFGLLPGHHGWRSSSKWMSLRAMEHWGGLPGMESVAKTAAEHWASWPATDMAREDLYSRDGQWSESMAAILGAVYPDFHLSGSLASIAAACRSQTKEELYSHLASAAALAGFDPDAMLASQEDYARVDYPNLGDPSWEGSELALAISADYQRDFLSGLTAPAQPSERKRSL